MDGWMAERWMDLFLLTWIISEFSLPRCFVFLSSPFLQGFCLQTFVLDGSRPLTSPVSMLFPFL